MNRSATPWRTFGSTSKRAGLASSRTWRRARLASCRHAAGALAHCPARCESVAGEVIGLPIEKSLRPVAAARITTIARRLLEESTLCAIATVAPSGRAHVNTVYFAWGRELEILWLSDPRARHSQNLRRNSSVAIAVYDSTQTWGQSDRGIQLFGTARPTAGRISQAGERVYARRFPEYEAPEFGAYHLYRFRPRGINIFDERALGSGVFVTASVGARGRVTWRRTERYRADA
jgi:uncharacterized protein YhbP (UPF0306 family)